MTNQVNQAFEKWNTPHYVHEDGTKCDMTLAKAAFQAATQASESEINSLKQRVEELEESILKQSSILYDNAKEMTLMQMAIENKDIDISALTASNNRLIEAGQSVVQRWDSPNWSDETHTRDYIEALRKALSSTPAQFKRDLKEI